MRATLAIIIALVAARSIAADVILYSTTAATPAYPAMVPKTGQTASYATGDDGDLEKGVAWPSPVWTIMANTNCVRHNLTGLVWARDIDGLLVTNTWDGQHVAVSNLNATAYGGRTDWRVPSIREAMSVFDGRYYQPALCNSAGTGQWTSGDPFIIASPASTRNFWASSIYPANTNNAMWVYIRYGNLSGTSLRTTLYYCWPCAGPD